jgi:hypothetical protein
MTFRGKPLNSELVITRRAFALVSGLLAQKVIELVADYSITLTRLLLEFGSIDDGDVAAHVANGAGSL